MKCPVCNVDLQMTDRQSIEIDYCPTCRGVWLDRGELDKLIERSSQIEQNQFNQNQNQFNQNQNQNNQNQYSHHQDNHNKYYKQDKYYKKKSFLSELFD